MTDKLTRYALLLTLLCAVITAQANDNFFTTKRGKLLDANGSNFVMRGVNMPHAWHSEESFEALDEIAKNGVNCVRIVWMAKLPAEGLDSIIQKCINLKMIPMVELHDATGKESADDLIKMAKYYCSEPMIRIYKKYEKYLLINIANEWGNHNTTSEYWRDSYSQCVDMMRSAGYRSTIVIDGPGWGQNITPILDYGSELIERDPHHNLLFSIHMYGSWNDPQKIKNSLEQVHQKQLPFIIGEFGYDYNEGDNNLKCRVDHKQLLNSCHKLKIGYLAWSWTGNNAPNRWLDMVEYSDWKTLTYWGDEIINSPKGIKRTTKQATIFKQH